MTNLRNVETQRKRGLLAAVLMAWLYLAAATALQSAPGLGLFDPSLVGQGRPLTAGLVSYWTMDEGSGTRNDSVSTNHLSISGTVGTDTGKISGAAKIATYDGGALSKFPAGGVDISRFTLAMWVKAGEAGYLGTIGSTGDWVNPYIDFEDAGIEVSPSGGSPVNVVSEVSFPYNQWNLLILWRDGTAFGLQINNGTPSTGTGPSPVGTGNYLNIIGYDGTLGPACSVDEVGFWNRVLTSDERTRLYNGGSGRTYPFTP